MSKGSGAERRVGERIATHHHVVFSDSYALGPLRMGVAVDRSSGGLRIITPHPEPLGTTLQIELRPSADSPSVLLLEGRVVHITPAEKGQHAMGIRLVQPALRPATPLPKRERRERAPSFAAMRPIQRPATASASGAGAVAVEAPLEEAVTFRRIEEGGRPGSWIALLGILALLIILCLLIVEALRDRDHLAAALTWFGGERAKTKVTIQEESLTHADSQKPSTSTDAMFADVRVASEVKRSRGRAATLGTFAVVPAMGRPVGLESGANATMRSGIPAELKGATPLSTAGFASMLDYADRAAARGETGLARAVVRRALARSGQVPESWVSLGTEYGDQLAKMMRRALFRCIKR